MSLATQDGLRHRPSKVSEAPSVDSALSGDHDKSMKEEVVWGKTPSGEGTPAAAGKLYVSN